MTNSAFARLTSALLTTAVLVLLGFTVAVSLLASPAHAGEPACTTDLDCAAYELQVALYTGADVAEDLSFAPGTAVYEDGSSRTGEPMSELYSAKNELLADAFWADHAGLDWGSPGDRQALADWLAEFRSA